MPNPFSALLKKLKPSQTTTDDRMQRSSNGKSNGHRAPSSSDTSLLTENFGRLSLGSGRPSTGRQDVHRGTANNGFAGGFAQPAHTRNDEMDWESSNLRAQYGPQSTRYTSNNGPPAMSFPEPQMYPPAPPGPLPAPPTMQMPVPQPAMSRTMQFATSGGELPPPPPPPKPDLRPPAAATMTRPHSDSGAFPASGLLRPPPSTPERRPVLHAAPHSAPAKPVSAGPSRPPLSSSQTPSRNRRASDSSSPSSLAASVASSPGKGVRKVQCCAVTKQDTRCQRMVVVSTPLALLSGEEERQFCHQHIKNAFKDVKFPSRKNPGVKVTYDDWIPEYLQESTKNVLREEMQKEASAADTPGYIYAYEIEDKDDPSVVHIKVGRAVKLNKRLGEWDDQCQSKETHLRGYWPMSEDAESNGMMRGRVQVGPPGPYCHRVERLVHLELADLALNAPYLHPDFPNVKSDVGIGNGGKRSAVRRECPDCGAVHKEIFTFPRATGRYEGKEWEEIVRPVIEKWGGFVEAYV
ncbi:hypothetical protein C8Q70DRAFT_1025302 [Cubamyces menziesii]|nr:hypothetical protein C8Q70DRAFT_1025302 [Cubamyces menziesii]